MSDPQKPRDKLPDVTYQGVIIPGLNSWCQSSAIDTTTAMEDEAQLGPGKPTNRCKYENKPMPPTPTTSTSKISESSNTSTQTSSINPFFKWGSGFQSMKNRAVTDPIIPKPLFADKKDKPHLSSKKSFGSGPNDKLSEEEKTKERQLLAVLDNPYQAFHVFGASKKTHDEVPASAPPARSDLAPFSLSAMDQCSKRSFSPDRIIKSTPVPTRRYLRENNLPMPPLPKTSPTKSEPTNVVGEEEPPKIECFQGMILGDGKLNPTITGSYSRVGEVEYVENDHRQRIESQIGVIETVESLNLSNEQDCKDSNPATESGQNPGATYSPSIYGGIWENDPNVVSLLSH